VAWGKVCALVTESLVQQFTSCASGKVIICGEYAVLESHPALVAPVDRAFKVTLHCEQNLDDRGVLFKALGMQAEGRLCAWQSGNTVSTEHVDELAMAVNAFNALSAFYFKHDDFREESWRLELDSSGLFYQGQKLGLGSSAALVVALDNALAQRAKNVELESATERWSRLHHLHSALQGKRGSGADIAAMVNASLCTFRNINNEACELSDYSLPEGLELAYVWSGNSASTPAFLRSLSTWKKEQPALFTQHLAALGEASLLVCESQTAEHFYRALADFTDKLYQFDGAAELGIFASCHAQLYQQSKQYDCLGFKPCGAGGGDLGLVFSHDKAQLQHYLADLTQRGFDIVPLNIAKRA